MSNSKVMERLSSKSDEFASYSANDMVELCNELLANFRNRAHEWSEVGSWTIEETKVQELYTAGSAPSPRAKLAVASARHAISSSFSPFVSTCLQNYEYEASGQASKKPEFLRKMRMVTMEDGRSYSIYGPVSSGIPGNTCELYTLPSKVEKTPVVENPVSKSGSVTVILGAGNQPNLTLFDILQRSLVHREVIFAKHHPLRPHLIKPYAIILEPLIKRGFLHQVLDLGVTETSNTLSHPSVGHVHITGSLATDKAVRATLAKSKPHLSESEVNEMVTSELGASTPVILADGTYTDIELTHAARVIVFGKKFNGGCNCLDAQVVVLGKEWKQKDQFRKVLFEELKRQPNQPSYYPGSRERARDMVNTYLSLGENRATVVECAESTGAISNPLDHVTVLECGTPDNDNYEGVALRKEAFGPILGIVELTNDKNTEDYLNSIAVPFVNNKENIYGSLSCILFAPKLFDAKKVDRAIESLEYGAIGYNTSNIIGWLGACLGAVWCAHPSAPGRESGADYCGNQFKIALPAKTVVRGPDLSQAPVFDGAKPPPTLIIDAMYTMDCSHSTFTGAIRILYLFIVTFANAVISCFIDVKAFLLSALSSKKTRVD